MQHPPPASPTPNAQREPPRWGLVTARITVGLGCLCVLLLMVNENVTYLPSPTTQLDLWWARCVLLSLAGLFFGYAAGFVVAATIGE
jgi:hypothetical protein